MEAERGAAAVNPGDRGQPPENQDLSVLLASLSTFFSEFGWYLLVLCVGLYFLIQHLSKSRTGPDQSRTSAAGQGDPLSVVQRQEALEAARRRMQAELDTKAAEFKEKQQRMEEEKRQKKIEMWESMKEGRSYKENRTPAQNNDEASSSSTATRPKTDKKPLRGGGYSPLTGDGGGTCSWRPGRRGPSAGGG